MSVIFHKSECKISKTLLFTIASIIFKASKVRLHQSNENHFLFYIIKKTSVTLSHKINNAV